MAEFLGSKTISNQFLGNKVILRTYKGDNLINEYEPLYNPPSDWSDIRTDCPENSIALYAAHKADFSQYDNLGFTVNCSGGYNVYIDGTQYGTTYTSGATCSITWSTSGITTGDDITTPSALKAHKIWIEPATEGNSITDFSCKRVASSGQEQQGLLWIHFNISNKINLYYSVNLYNQYRNLLLTAITAKNNKLTARSFESAFWSCPILEYLPDIDFDNSSVTFYNSFGRSAELSTLTLKNGTINNLSSAFEESGVSKIKTKNITVNASNVSNAFKKATNIEDISTLNINWASVTNATDFITNATSLKDTVLDVSSATGLTKIGCYGDSSHFMTGFKGLRVSSSAPFSNATAPQINVSYTGMDRAALTTLFDDLPYNVGYEVVGSPTINNGVVSGFSSSDYLKMQSFLNSLVNVEYVVRCKPIDVQNASGRPLGYGTYTATYNGGNYACGPYFYQNKLWLLASIIGPTSSSTTYRIETNYSVTADTWYTIKVTHTSNTVTLFAKTDNTEYSQIGQLTNVPVADFDIGNLLLLGTAWGGLSPYSIFNGSIDLNNTYIKVNDVYWFRGQPAMTKTINVVGCLGNQLNTIGSPTISDGIVSVSSNSDIVKTTQSFIYNNNGKYEIYTRFKTPQTLSGVNSVFGKIDIWNTPILYITENSLLFRLPDNSELYSGFSNINADTYYRTKIVGDYGVWTIWLYSDSGVQIATASKDISETSAQSSGVLLIDSFYGNSYPTQYVDLNETYIKVNNNTWFDINNCLLPEDRAIVTDKGWAITYQ